MNLYRAALLVIATSRAIRFVTEDDLGEWLIQRPVRRWANRHDRAGEYIQHRDRPDLIDAMAAGTAVEPDFGWRSKLASGADCPWCIGLWIGGAILATEVVTSRRGFRWARPAQTFVLTTLALNSVANLYGAKSGTQG
jgi:hypothetical protein